MQEQADPGTDRPFPNKRDRKQSKGYQGLISKEPVTKSPFRARVAGRSGGEAPLPPLPSAHVQAEEVHMHHHHVEEEQQEEERHEEERQEEMTPSAQQHQSARDGSPSPFRSSLVSKRLHGPRLSGSSGEARRQRRKTVTFDEECDVVEFDTESHEDFTTDDSDAEHYGDAHEDEERGEEEGHGSYERDESMDMEMDMEVDVQDIVRDMEVDEQQERQSYHPAHDLRHANTAEDEPAHDEAEVGAHTEDSFESVPLDGESAEADDSITGMVNFMLGQASAAPAAAAANTVTTGLRTPERTPTLASDNEGGVPYGRTHHYERALENRARETPQSRIVTPAPAFPLSANRNIARTPSPPNSLPKSARRMTSPSPLSQSPMSPSDIPLGRSTHAERARAERQVDEEVERGVRGLEGSPSPAKPGRPTTSLAGANATGREDDLVPRFDVSFTRSEQDEEKGEFQ